MMESDRDYRARLINAYGMWGAFCTVILESSGGRLDEIGAELKCARLRLPPDHDPGDEDRS